MASFTSNMFTLTVGALTTPPSSPVALPEFTSFTFGADIVTFQKSSAEFVFESNLKTKCSFLDALLTPPSSPVPSSLELLISTPGEASESERDGGSSKRRRVTNDTPPSSSLLKLNSHRRRRTRASASSEKRGRHQYETQASSPSDGALNPNRPTGIVLRLRIPESIKLQRAMDKLYI